ncbi:MAG: formylglycine-generating enzyme family protein [Nitrospinota bacterium]
MERPLVKLAGEKIGKDFQDDYDSFGEPKCENCHSGDRRPATDYTGDPECLQCHNAGYSERFIAMDQKYRKPEFAGGVSYRAVQAGDYQSGTAIRPVSDKKGSAKAPEGMVIVPSGEFIMGVDGWWPKSGPQHKRTLPDFFIDIFEVTNIDFQKFVQAKGHHQPDHWKVNNGKIPSGKEKHPVTYVNWFDADAYCKWRGKRLPTEAEWEKAARGVDGRVFPWGNEFEKNRANTPQYGAKDTMPVGSFKGGMSPYGVDDMAGNVFEWTQDWYKPYPGNTHPDPNEGERYRVIRGGSWYDCTYYKCGISAPSFNRIFFNPFTRNNNFGFRCAKSSE